MAAIVPTKPNYSKSGSNGRNRPSSNKSSLYIDSSSQSLLNDTLIIDSDSIDKSNNIPISDDLLSPTTANNYANKHHTSPHNQQIIQLILDCNGIKRDDYEHNIQSIHTLTIFQLYKFRSIDTHLCQFTHLTSLEIMHQNITHITGLQYCTQLEIIRLAGNSIESIDGLQSLVKLQQLYLGQNKICKLNNLDTLHSLTILSAHDNNISYIDITHNTQLTSLNLASNQINTIIGCLSNQTNLTQLNLADNNISTYDDIRYLTQYCPKLRSLTFHDAMYGINPVCELMHYNLYTTYLLADTQIDVLDHTLLTKQSFDHSNSILLKKQLYYNLRIKSIKQLKKQLCTAVENAIRNILLTVDTDNDVLQSVHTSTIQAINHTTKQLVDEVTAEMNTAGNIRVEYSNDTHPAEWYHNVIQQINTTQTIQYITKLHNQHLLNTFNRNVDELLTDINQYPYTTTTQPQYHYAFTSIESMDKHGALQPRTTYYKSAESIQHNTAVLCKVYDHTNQWYTEDSQESFQPHQQTLFLPEYIITFQSTTNPRPLSSNVSQLHTKLHTIIQSNILYHNIVDTLMQQFQSYDDEQINYCNSEFTALQHNQLLPYSYLTPNHIAAREFTQQLLCDNAAILHNKQCIAAPEYMRQYDKSLNDIIPSINIIALNDIIWHNSTMHDFIQYAALSDLTLNNCAITSLNPIRHCTQLQTLTLQHNALLSIELQYLSSMTQLQRLDVSHNQIKSLSGINDKIILPGMKYLNVEYNQIDSLHDICHTCPNIIELFIQSNKLDAINIKHNIYSIQRCTSLLILDCDRSLYLNPTKSTIYYFTVYQCKSLQIFNESIVTPSDRQRADQLFIGVLDESIIHNTINHTSYQSIQSLQLNQLKLRDISVITQSLMPVLHTLDISNNMISDYTTFQPLSSLVVLKLNNNMLHKNNSNPTALSELYINLQHLECQYNKLISIQKLNLKHSTQLHYIDCSYNSIERLDRIELQHCTQLQVLNMSQNCVKLIDRNAFQSCHNTLIQLNLQSNALKSIDWLCQFTYNKLQILLLMNNRIHSLNELQHISQHHLLSQLLEFSINNSFLQRQPMTRFTLIYLLQSCSIIDGMPVNDNERQRALVLFSPPPAEPVIDFIDQPALYIQQPLQNTNQYNISSQQSLMNNKLLRNKSLQQPLSFNVLGQSIRPVQSQPVVYTPITAQHIQPQSTRLQYLTLNGLGKKLVNNKR